MLGFQTDKQEIRDTGAGSKNVVCVSAIEAAGLVETTLNVKTKNHRSHCCIRLIFSDKNRRLGMQYSIQSQEFLRNINMLFYRNPFTKEARVIKCLQQSLHKQPNKK